MSRIVITGAGGLLGSRLISVLASHGYEDLLGLVRKESYQSAKDSIQFVEINVLDLVGLEQTFMEGDIVVHCAGIVSYDPNKSKEMMRTNEIGTSNVINAALQKKIKKLIHISSVVTLGQKNPGQEVDESCIWISSPQNSQYAISKFKSEQEVWRGIYEGLSATILNPAFILGEGDFHKSSLKIIQTIDMNDAYYPEGANGFVDIDDVVKAILVSIEGDFEGQRFIICAANLTYHALYEKMRIGLGKPFKSKKLPTWAETPIVFLDFMRSFFTGRPRSIHRDTVTVTKQVRKFNNAKSKQILGLKYTSIDETIAKMTSRYKKEFV